MTTETAPPREETTIHLCEFEKEIAGFWHNEPLKLVIAFGRIGCILDLTVADAAGLSLSLASAVQSLSPSPNEALRRAEVIGHA